MLHNHAYNPRGRTVAFRETKLAHGITASQTGLDVESVTGLPSVFPYYLSINSTEVVKVTSASDTHLTVERAQFATRATASFPGKPVYYSRYLPTIGTKDYGHNLVIQKLYGYIAIGDALADDSPGVNWLDESADDWLTYVQPRALDMWTGFSREAQATTARGAS